MRRQSRATSKASSQMNRNSEPAADFGGNREDNYNESEQLIYSEIEKRDDNIAPVIMQSVEAGPGGLNQTRSTVPSEMKISGQGTQ